MTIRNAMTAEEVVSRLDLAPHPEGGLFPRDLP